MYSTQLTPGQAQAWGIGGIIGGAIVAIVAYVVGALLLGRIFRKAGRPAWAAWVPIYDSWVLLEIGGQKGWLSVLPVLGFIPVIGWIASLVTVVFTYIAMHHIGRHLGKSNAFVLWAIFIPIVWLIWLAVDKSKWQKPQVADA